VSAPPFAETRQVAAVIKKAKLIEIKAGMVKTASRRVIPILPNLALWLKPHCREAGELGFALPFPCAKA
jgi:hypothetical protein